MVSPSYQPHPSHLNPCQTKTPYLPTIHNQHLNHNVEANDNSTTRHHLPTSQLLDPNHSVATYLPIFVMITCAARAYLLSLPCYNSSLPISFFCQVTCTFMKPLNWPWPAPFHIIQLRYYGPSSPLQLEGSIWYNNNRYGIKILSSYYSIQPRVSWQFMLIIVFFPPKSPIIFFCKDDVLVYMYLMSPMRKSKCNKTFSERSSKLQLVTLFKSVNVRFKLRLDTGDH